MCPSLQATFEAYNREHPVVFNRQYGTIPGISAKVTDAETFKQLYYSDKDFKPGTTIDMWGVGHEPGSEKAFHMTYMHNPMKDFDSVEQIESYPFPVFDLSNLPKMTQMAKQFHDQGLAVMGNMQCTVWETAWYMRGMENLMTDMMLEEPIATAILDRVTEISVARARSYAESGVDVLFVGDDIGMQHTVMMSDELYCRWLKPRIAKVIAAAKAINPNIIVFYHSCGFVTPFIPHLIDVGVDVLNPVQPECMRFEEIHEMYGDRLSFHGTIGTQTTMPFGTPEEVRREVFKNLDIAGKKGGLFVAPTHLLEPEVPIENVVAYIKACREYCR